MALYFITGVAGSGKSTVTLELRKRGYEAYDSDDDLARWQNKRTGYVHPKSTVKSEDRTQEFLKNHAWQIPRSEVQKLFDKAKDNIIFLCGVASNESQLQDLFEKIFELTIDDATITHRLSTRTNNNWGKQSHELQKTLDENHSFSTDYTDNNYVIIDAIQAIELVVDEILNEIEQLGFEPNS
jgi:dephospho-CoA kinase